jgi:hypothetical protein
MRSSIRILANARDLPRNFNAGLIGADFEAVLRDLPGNNRLRELAQDGELITIVAVEDSTKECERNLFAGSSG